MDTYLVPIENPSGFLMKLAYYFTRRQFGKVLTPLSQSCLRALNRHSAKRPKVPTSSEGISLRFRRD